MKTAKRLIALLLALTLALALGACGNSASNDTTTDTTTPEDTAATDTADTGSEPTYGGDITVYFQEFYNDYDPSVADMRNYAIWYESLFAMDWSREDASEVFTSEYMTMEWMKGQIAEDYSFEGSDLTVTIRDDVFFQDKAPYNGRQLTAEDVKWSYDRLLGTGSGFDTPYTCDTNWRTVLFMVDSIEVTGDYTVVFHFNTDSEVALNTFITSQVCIAGHEWDELTAEEKADWHNAAGTGPYILEEYVADSYMKFVRNDNYYDYDERYPENKLPYLDSITLQMVTDSTNAETQFVAGNLDVIAWGGNVLSNTEAEMLRDTMSEDDYTEYSFLSAPPGIGLKQTVPALADVRVRTALQMAINSQEIYQDYYGYTDKELNIPGLFALVTQYSSVDDWSQELKDSYYTYDPEGAKALLEEAGYGDGFSFDVVIFGALDADLFTLVASYLSEIGVTMNVSVANSPPEMQQIGFDETNPSSIFVSGGWCRLSSIYMTFASTGSNNSIFANDAHMDELLDTFNTATTMAEAESAGKALDQYFAEQHWVLDLGGAEIINTFVSDRIGGYSGERLWKNWNANAILARIWVND